jgi:hypothetical protein
MRAYSHTQFFRTVYDANNSSYLEWADSKMPINFTWRRLEIFSIRAEKRRIF